MSGYIHGLCILCLGSLDVPPFSEWGGEKRREEISSCQDSRYPWVPTCNDTAPFLSDLYIKVFVSDCI